MFQKNFSKKCFKKKMYLVGGVTGPSLVSGLTVRFFSKFLGNVFAFPVLSLSDDWRSSSASKECTLPCRKEPPEPRNEPPCDRFSVMNFFFNQNFCFFNFLYTFFLYIRFQNSCKKRQKCQKRAKMQKETETACSISKFLQKRNYIFAFFAF